MMRFAFLACVILIMAATSPATADDADGNVPRIVPVQSDGGYVPPKPKKGFRYPDCFCTDSAGRRVEMGMTSCLKIGSQSFLARCDMSLNNPTWRRVDDTCPAPSS